MKLNISEIIRNICVELIKADASFTLAQHNVYLDIFKQELSYLNLQDSFLSIDELTLKLFLKPCQESWFSRLLKLLNRKVKYNNYPLYKLVGPNYPNHIVCEIKIKRKENKFISELALDGNSQKEPIYVSYP